MHAAWQGPTRSWSTLVAKEGTGAMTKNGDPLISRRRWYKSPSTTRLRNPNGLVRNTWCDLLGEVLSFRKRLPAMAQEQAVPLQVDDALVGLRAFCLPYSR